MQAISLGVGVQSVAMYIMSSIGELPRADYAIFADPGREKRKTYEYLVWLSEWAKNYDGIPIVTAKGGDLYKDLLLETNSTGERFASIPAFIRNDDGDTGMLRRQCTNEYKIAVVDSAIRRLYGLKPGQRRARTEVWMGITLDEIERMAKPIDSNAWRINVYPFLGYQVDRKEARKWEHGKLFSRQDLIRWYERNGLPIPPKSGCVFCPYHSDAAWKQMKDEEPQDFADAVKVDYAIRNSIQKGINKPAFLHRSLTPLDEVEFNESSPLFIECSGNCHL